MMGQVQARVTCPGCGGTGQERHVYHYKPQHRRDTAHDDLVQASLCRLCGGSGQVEPGVVTRWQRVQALPECPVCKGQGGKYLWEWAERETGARKQFMFEACAVCGGAQHVTPEQMAGHERARRKIRLWGVGCAAVAVLGGVFALTQVVSLVVYQAPLLACCAPPNLIFVGSMMLLAYGVRWLW